MTTLQEFLTTGVFAFIVTFARFGTAAMIMPGIGDSFVSQRVRLLIALAISFAVFPIVIPYLPKPIPDAVGLAVLVGVELIVGLLIGTVARIFMTAMDTAGMVVSFSSSLSNAQVFNPGLAAQGSLIGAFFSVTGVVIFFSLNLHHLVIMGLLESYKLFPVGAVPDQGSMAEIIARAVSASFNIGVMIGAPFLVMTLVLYVGMGVLTRPMPQIQVFMLALPLQILLALIAMFLILSAAYAFWAGQVEQALVFFFSTAQPSSP